MKYSCHFLNRDTDEVRSIVVDLSADEINSIETKRANADSDTALVGEAYALRHAYKEAPHGFLHYKPPTLTA